MTIPGGQLGAGTGTPGENDDDDPPAGGTGQGEIGAVGVLEENSSSTSGDEDGGEGNIIAATFAAVSERVTASGGFGNAGGVGGISVVRGRGAVE